MGVIVLATRNDVAKLANVSPAVVSYVINNSNYVSAEKRQAVLEAIEKLDYHPSYAAKSLKKHQTYQLLMLVDDVRTELFDEIGYYMEQYAFQRGYFVSIASCTSEKALKYLDVCFSKRYDGVFMVSNVYTSKHMNLIASKGIPVVLYLTRFYEGEKSLGPDICKIDCDYIGNIGKMIDYLIDVRRRRNIGYVISPGIGSTEDEQKPWGDGMRIWGYMRALERRGLPIRINNFFTLRQDHNESFTRRLHRRAFASLCSVTHTSGLQRYLHRRTMRRRRYAACYWQKGFACRRTFALWAWAIRFLHGSAIRASQRFPCQRKWLPVMRWMC